MPWKSSIRRDSRPVVLLGPEGSGSSLLARIGIAVGLWLCCGSAAVAATTIGTLPGDETWSGTVLITGDVTVPPGVTLTIEAGTLIQTRYQRDDLAAGLNTARIELIIEGTLDLQGTPGLPVTFTSTRSTPRPGDWYGIRLMDTADSTVVIHDLVIEGSIRGIWGDPGSHHDVVNCTVRETTEHGIYMEFGDSPRDAADPGILLSGNTVEQSGLSSSGIELVRSGSLPSWDDAVHQIVDNVTDETGTYGMYVSAGVAERVEISNNDISDAEYGMRVSGALSLLIADNTVATGGLYGIYASAGSVLIADNNVTGVVNGIYAGVRDGRIVRNTLTGGDTGTGIRATTPISPGPYEVAVHRNDITDFGTGISVEWANDLTALYNSLTNLSSGFFIKTRDALLIPRIHWNNIDATTWDALMLNNSHLGGDMRRNYWSATSGEMQAKGYPANIDKIYDIHEQDGLGRIDYRGFENLPVDTAVSLESRFVWPFPGDTLSAAGITIMGTAYADAGVQRVEISTNGGASWQPADGTEAWTFAFMPSADGLQDFLCRVIDDNDAVETTPDALTVDFDFSLPTTQGALPASESWSGDITLTGDIIVPAGTTLTIEPGTTLWIQSYADNLHGGIDESRVELIVEGTLVAQGPGSGSIRLTSAAATPHHSNWYGIRYTGAARPLPVLRGVSLEWGETGVSHEGNVGIPSMEDVTIFQMKQHGISATSAPVGTGAWTFRNLHLYEIRKRGAWLLGGPTVDVLVEGATIENTDDDAMELEAGGVVTIRDSTFETAGNPTFVALNIRDAETLLVKGIESRILTLTGYGLQAGSIGTATIEDSEFSGGRYGVYVAAEATTILNSRITDGRWGVLLFGEMAQLEDSHVGNTTEAGVTVYADNTLLRFNDFDPASGYALESETANPIDASDNYWGVATTVEMDAEGCFSDIAAIFDAHDDGSLGLVTYCDYASGPFGDRATIQFEENGADLEIRWNPKGGLTYDLIGGNLAALSPGAGIVDLGTVSCLETANGDGVIVDTSGAPPTTGEVWFYLLRDGDTPGGYGHDSAGQERDPTGGDCL